MAGATKRSPLNIPQAIRARGPQAEGARGRAPYTMPRVINVAWASIIDGDVLPGELVANRDDNSLVWRRDETNIYRFNNDATRTI